jgi:acetolactate synthase regulatory subunit
MSARKIQDETEAREHIAKMRESGLTLATWARSAGIDGRSLHAWNVNLSRSDSNAARKTPKVRRVRDVKLVELVPMSTVASSARYTVRVGQFAIDVDARFEEATLRRLIGVLRSC